MDLTQVTEFWISVMEGSLEKPGAAASVMRREPERPSSATRGMARDPVRSCPAVSVPSRDPEGLALLQVWWEGSNESDCAVIVSYLQCPRGTFTLPEHQFCDTPEGQGAGPYLQGYAKPSCVGFHGIQNMEQDKSVLCVDGTFQGRCCGCSYGCWHFPRSTT